MSETTATTVRVVFEMESDDAPTVIGTYLGTTEDAVYYRGLDGVTTWAPQDCVRVVEVPV